MHPVTKTSGVAISALVAATATVLLLLPGYSRARAPRGAVTSAAVVVASPGPARARPLATPRPRPAAAGPGAWSAPGCRVAGDGTAGAHPATCGRHPCRHPLHHWGPVPGQAHRGPPARPAPPPLPPAAACRAVGAAPAAGPAAAWDTPAAARDTPATARDTP
jgi:hypothetical protein